MTLLLELDALATARTALLDSLSVPVLIRGDSEPMPEPDRVVVLELVASGATPMIGDGGAGRTVLQCGCYAESTAGALILAGECRTALLDAGFSWRGGRPTPLDPKRPNEYGYIADFDI